MNIHGYFHPEDEYYRFWTQEEEAKLKLLAATNKYSYKEIGKILNRSSQSCQGHASWMGIKNKYNLISGKKYTVNENFWSKPNYINCYWAGFSAADASIVKYKRNGFSYCLEISEKDEKHLKKLVDDCSFNGKIYKYNRKDRDGCTVKIRINSIKWAEDLKNVFNIEPNKTKRLAPPNNLTLNQYFCWTLGYICGDGTVYMNKYNNQIHVNFVSSSLKIIEWLQQFIESNFKDVLRIKKIKIKKNNKCEAWHYSISGIRAAIFVDYLRQFPVPRLSRKWDNPQVLEKISEYKQQYPHLFKTLDQEKMKELS